MTVSATTISIRRLTPVFGAEITSVDLRDLDDAAFADIEAGFVMYDNRAALHRARPYAITTHPRVLHRTTVADEGPAAG